MKKKKKKITPKHDLSWYIKWTSSYIGVEYETKF